jgi:hypothetical protein
MHNKNEETAMNETISVTATCTNGHKQTVAVFGMATEWVKAWAALMDGTSPFYVASPRGTDSMIGKCGICGSQIDCTVENTSDRDPLPQRVARLEAESLQNVRLGPNPKQDEDFEHEREETVKRIVESAKQPSPVDRGARVLADGSPVTEDHREINPATGQQKDYVVLTAEERGKGFVRPVRRTYIHVGLNPKMSGIVLIKAGEHGCGSRTTMALPIAETYARDPEFYSGTFCCSCSTHRPLEEFVWEGTTERVGS